MSPDSEHIARMMRRAGISCLPSSGTGASLERFARLAASSERDACARVAAITASTATTEYGNGYNQAAIDIERAISARGKP